MENQRLDAHPMNPAILLVPRSDGTYTVRRYSMVGGYPIAYLTGESSVLCGTCVAEEIYAGSCSTVTQHFVNWEDSSLYCEGCDETIESAYGESN